MHVISRRTEYKVKRDIALGAGRWVDVFHHGYESDSLINGFQQIKNKGYTIVATTPHTEDFCIDTIDISQPLAIAFGTERRGISDELLELADAHVKIPMYGFTESFNLSVSAALALQVLRQRLTSSTIPWKLNEQEQTALKIQWCIKILNGGEALHARFLEEAF
jgi:tRNA (guanosine-2'-O-)-methyltransferase